MREKSGEKVLIFTRSSSMACRAALSILAFLHVISLVLAYQCNSGSFFSGTLPCSLCSAGSFCKGEDLQEPCPAGSYQPSTGASSCIPCSPGYYGTVVGSKVSTDCSICGIGKFSPSGAGVCSPCNPGTICVSGGCPSCSSCSPGTSSVSGSSTCNPCPIGTFSNRSGSVCIPCSPGFATLASSGNGYCQRTCTGWPSSFSADGAGACCAPGRSAQGSSSCTSCLAGFFAQILINASATMTNCTPCPPGSSSSALGATLASTCKTCAPGTFQPDHGSPSCKPCPPGSFSTVVGAVNASVCTLCPANTAGGGSSLGACVSCLAGTYSASGWGVCCPPGQAAITGGLTCSPCPAGKWGNGAGPCNDCPSGTYLPSTGGASLASCLACPAGSFSKVIGYEGFVVVPARCPNSCFPAVHSCEFLCPAGSWSVSNSSSCTPCSAGKYSDTINGLATSPSVCIVCPTGTSSAAGAAACCTPGGVLNSVASVCSSWQPGCSSCGTQKQTADAGCSVCNGLRPLSSGTSATCSLALASPVCSACQRGFYSGISENATGCLRCPPGKTSEVAAVSVNDCFNCSSGSFSNPSGSYSVFGSSGFYSVSGQTCDYCPAGSDTKGLSGSILSDCE